MQQKNTTPLPTKWYDKKGEVGDKKPANLKTHQPKKYVPKPKCHEGVVHVFDIERSDGTKVAVTAGGAYRDGHWLDASVLPSVVIGPANVIDPIDFPSGWHVKMDLPVFLPIPWPDFKTPLGISYEFWKLLWEDLHVQDIDSIHCMCQGGHGRTGTMLSILYGMEHEGFKTASEIIESVRNIYCHEIVENDEQAQYVADVLGIEKGEFKGSKSWYGNWNDKPKKGTPSPSKAPVLASGPNGYPNLWDDIEDELETYGFLVGGETPQFQVTEVHPAEDEKLDLAMREIEDLAEAAGVWPTFEFDGSVTLEHDAHRYRHFADLQSAKKWLLKEVGGDKQEDSHV